MDTPTICAAGWNGSRVGSSPSERNVPAVAQLGTKIAMVANPITWTVYHRHLNLPL